jgi:hypothetical protein
MPKKNFIPKIEAMDGSKKEISFKVGVKSLNCELMLNN